MADCEICGERPAVTDVPAYSPLRGTFEIGACRECAEDIDCTEGDEDG